MIFNYTHNHQLTTIVTMDNVPLQVVEEAKLLGTYITNDLKWDLNTKHIVKQSNSRMQLLRKAMWISTESWFGYTAFCILLVRLV